MKLKLMLLLCVVVFANQNLISDYNEEKTKEILNKIDMEKVLDNLEQLTGEKETVIDGEPYTIKSRKHVDEGNDKAARFLKAKLEEYGYGAQIMLAAIDTVGDDNYLYSETVIVVSKGSELPDEQIVFCAHYDSEGEVGNAPGADDNGSGVVTVLEAARILKNIEHKRTILFVFWDCEEYGAAAGSWIFADSIKNAGIENLKCLNVDMIGYNNAENPKVLVCGDTSEIHKVVRNAVAKSGEIIDISSELDMGCTIDGSDGLSFSYAGYPTANVFADVSMAEMNPNYHSENDKIENMTMDYFLENLTLGIGALILLAEPEGESSVDFDFIGSGLISAGQFYPNPVSGTAGIDIINNGPEIGVELSLYNLNGRRIPLTYNDILVNGKNTIWLDLSKYNLPADFYLCYCTLQTGERIVRKIFYTGGE